MKFFILSVGHKMPAWVNAAFAEYTKRMPREACIQLIEIKPEKRASGKSTAQILESERASIFGLLPQNCLIIALDEHGGAITTQELAQNMRGWMQSGRDVAFIIGGADGLHEAVKARAERLLALSALTLPHALVRVLLAEQLYRALSIIQNHPYHRE